jgi:hypothetical protein
VPPRTAYRSASRASRAAVKSSPSEDFEREAIGLRIFGATKLSSSGNVVSAWLPPGRCPLRPKVQTLRARRGRRGSPLRRGPALGSVPGDRVTLQRCHYRSPDQVLLCGRSTCWPIRARFARLFTSGSYAGAGCWRWRSYLNPTDAADRRAAERRAQ